MWSAAQEAPTTQAGPRFGQPASYPPPPGHPAPGHPAYGYPPARFLPGAPTSPVLPWAIACTPVIGVVVVIAAVASHNIVFVAISPFLGVLAGWLASLALGVVDTRQLQAAGWAPAPWVWALLGPWLYLLMRALRRRGLVPKPGWTQLVVAAVLWVMAWNAAAIVAETALTRISHNHHAQASVER